jgi:hypothetical protein
VEANLALLHPPDLLLPGVIVLGQAAAGLHPGLHQEVVRRALELVPHAVDRIDDWLAHLAPTSWEKLLSGNIAWVTGRTV